MIRRADWALLGLREVRPGDHGMHLIPSGAAAQPFRGMGEFFPRWAAARRETLTIGLACSLNEGFPRQLITAFRAAHPEVDLVLEDLDDAELPERLNGRRIDIALALDSAGQRGWRALPLWHEHMVAFVAEGHPLAAEDPIDPAALRAEPVLIAGDGSGSKSLEKAITTALGGRPAVFLHCPVQRDTLLDMVGLGLGVTLAGSHALGALHAHVCSRQLDSETDLLTYSAFWLTENGKDAVRSFLETARDLPLGPADSA
jgi:DNA-binding transcriptional LysR family regulator